MLRQVPLALIVVVLAVGSLPAAAESNDDVPLRFSYVEGEDNIPPGCVPFEIWADWGDMGLILEDSGFEPNPCHQIATSMNGLDAPKIDVLLIVPASPTAERDLRLMRQSVQMWADGIDWLAQDMGLDWLADGVEFRLSTQIIDNPGTFTEYAILDPEIVVIASNPVGGLGIGVDPQWLASEMLQDDRAREGPCHGIKDPFDMDAWLALPGFDSHHGGSSGTYVEDCDGAGGNICFSVNAAIDPDTETLDLFQLYDLVSHENGHCLTLGHVGDGAEGSWDNVPVNDIMAYNQAPLARSKCVSTLNVEAFVVTMSKYLDVNGDGQVDDEDRIWANDAIGEGDFRPFQIQQPGNHYYASPTRQAQDCPQPDMSLQPLSEVRDFTPDAPARSYLQILDIQDHSRVAQGPVHVAGSVHGEVPSHLQDLALPTPAIVLEDPAGDAELPHYDILNVDATMTEETLEVVVTYADLRPDEGQTVAPQYSLGVGPATFYAWNDSPYVTWDMAGGTITFSLPRAQMADGITDNAARHHVLPAPYEVRTWVYSGPGHHDSNFDYAPELLEPALLIGPEIEPADAPYVLLQADGRNVTAPIREDGNWGANVDLSGIPAMNTTTVSATWYTPEGYIIDSDRIAVVVDPSVPVDTAFNTGVGSSIPGFEACFAVAVLVGAVAMVRRRA